MIDGATDYPIALGRQTYQDSVVPHAGRPGNITADPTNAAAPGGRSGPTCATARLPAPDDPYAPMTNSDVVVSQSFDGGATWSAPSRSPLAGDQFQPWGAYRHDRHPADRLLRPQHDPANHLYDYSSRPRPAPARSPSRPQVTTVRPTRRQGDRWFAATLNAAFPFATSFIGDYSNIAATPTGGVVAYWTDMRETACFAGACRSGSKTRSSRRRRERSLILARPLASPERSKHQRPRCASCAAGRRAFSREATSGAALATAAEEAEVELALRARDSRPMLSAWLSQIRAARAPCRADTPAAPCR